MKNTKKTTARKTPPRKTRKKGNSNTATTPEERYLAIEECAYLKAEGDGFKKDPADYWLAAEAELGP